MFDLWLHFNECQRTYACKRYVYKRRVQHMMTMLHNNFQSLDFFIKK